MTTLIALLLAGVPVEWAEVPWYQLLRRARVVVAGEVVHVEIPPKGPPVARLKVESVLKGRPEGEEIRVPFKTDHTWSCDFTISYTKGKRYLLLIDDENPFRVVHYPAGTCDEIPGLDAPAVRFVRMALDIDAGRHRDRRLPELLETVHNKLHSREALHLFRTVPREHGRPLQAAVRQAYGMRYRKLLAEDTHNLYRRHSLLVDAEITRDLSLVGELLRTEPRSEPDLLGTLAVVTGHRAPSLAAFRTWWTAVDRRARVRSRPEAAAPLLEALGASDPAERSGAGARILELGPDVLPTVRARLQSADSEVRARISDLLRELELMADLRDDLAQATAGG